MSCGFLFQAYPCQSPIFSVYCGCSKSLKRGSNVKNRGYTRRTRRRDILWLRRTARRYKNRIWRICIDARAQIVKNLTAFRAEEGDVVKISECWGEKIITNEKGVPRRFAPGQRVILHHISTALRAKKADREAYVDMTEGVTTFVFPETHQNISIQDLPLHLHMTLVNNFNQQISAPQTARRQRRALYTFTKPKFKAQKDEWAPPRRTARL